MAEGIPSGQVVNILEDNAGTIWLDLEYEGFANYQPTSDAPLVWIESGSKNMIPGERGIFTCDGHDYLNVTRKEDLVYSWRVVDDTQHTVLQDWSPYSLQKTIMTPRMLPGRYQLQVRSQDKDRNTSRVSASLGFTVAPYFWTTPHFLILLFPLQ